MSDHDLVGMIIEKNNRKFIKTCLPKKSKNQQDSKLHQIKGKQKMDLKAISNELCKLCANVGKALQLAIPTLSNNIWKSHDYGIGKKL